MKHAQVALLRDVFCEVAAADREDAGETLHINGGVKAHCVEEESACFTYEGVFAGILIFIVVVVVAVFGCADLAGTVEEGFDGNVAVWGCDDELVLVVVVAFLWDFKDGVDAAGAH